MPDHLYIDEHHHVYTDAEARSRIATSTDSRFVSESDGILAVDRERWKRAQAYERAYWMDKQIHAIQDRNASHAKCFDGYRALAGKDFHRAIELGCGPFTNLRMIALCCSIGACSLEDPLIGEYLSHPNCSYSKRYLALNYKIHKKHIAVRGLRFISKGLPGHWGIRVATALSRLLAPKIPVASIIATGIEQMPDNLGVYDLVIMVNVLEHCQNVPAIFEKILGLSKTGTYFVFADKLFDERDIEDITNQRLFEAGHPLMPKRGYVEQFLETNFVPIYSAIHREEADVHEFDRTHDVLYYIGIRK